MSDANAQIRSQVQEPIYALRNVNASALNKMCRSFNVAWACVFSVFIDCRAFGSAIACKH